MEPESPGLRKALPPPVAAVSGAPAPALPDRAAVAAWLASLPAGAPLALDWAGNARPPDPRLAGIAVFHPAAGAARVPSPDAVPLGDLEVRVHDAKPLVEAWLAHGVALPPIQDSAVAAYLLNPARSAYRLEELCLEAFGECPPPLPAPAAVGAGAGSSAPDDTRSGAPPAPAVDDAELGRGAPARARGVHRHREHLAAELPDK